MALNSYKLDYNSTKYIYLDCFIVKRMFTTECQWENDVEKTQCGHPTVV